MGDRILNRNLIIAGLKRKLLRHPLVRDLWIRSQVLAHDLEIFPVANFRRWKKAYEMKKCKTTSESAEFPLLCIETTNECNARCVMCPIGRLTRPIGIMEWDLYKKIIDEYCGYNCGPLDLSNFGEPLLDPLFIRRVKYAKEKGLIVETISNGSLLDKQTCQDLVNVGLDRIIISIDASTQKTYKTIRKGLNFEKVKANVEQLITLKSAAGVNKPEIVVSFTRMPENYDELFLFFKQWEGKVVQICIGDNLQSRGGAIKGVKQSLLYRRNSICRWPMDRMVIFQNGDVTLCCEDWDGKAVVGNLLNKTIVEIWRSEEMHRVRAAMFRCAWDELPKICSLCTTRRMVLPWSPWWM